MSKVSKRDITKLLSCVGTGFGSRSVHNRPFNWSLKEMEHEIPDMWIKFLSRLKICAPGSQKHAVKLSQGYKHGIHLCESPIEVILFTALMTHNWGSSKKPVLTTYCKSDKEFCSLNGRVKIKPQCKFMGARFDFLMQFSRVGTPKFISIEADGIAFHDKKKDRDRDLKNVNLGVYTLRIPGAEIYKEMFLISDGIDAASKALEEADW